MYCTNCGNRIYNDDKYCTRCGNKIDINVNQFNDSNNVEKKSYSGKKIASIVLGSISIFLSMLVIFAPLSLCMAIIGLILSFVALKNEKNFIGIILNLIGLVISSFICIMFMFVIRYVVTDMDTSWLNDFEYRDNFGFGEHSGRF